MVIKSNTSGVFSAVPTNQNRRPLKYLTHTLHTLARPPPVHSHLCRAPPCGLECPRTRKLPTSSCPDKMHTKAMHARQTSRRRICARACVCACVRVCLCACVCVCVCVQLGVVWSWPTASKAATTLLSNPTCTTTASFCALVTHRCRQVGAPARKNGACRAVARPRDHQRRSSVSFQRVRRPLRARPPRRPAYPPETV
jgi:hypothetical protein